MNEMTHGGLAEPAEPASAFRFTGSWRDYAPIAFTNLLLTIVTLGVYRFWAQARTRRYLWSRTEFIDDSLEWTGTGKEMFLGILIVAAILIPVLLFLQFGLQALVLRGQAGLAGVIGVSLYLGLLYLAGVALFRALRYRLSRTLWHGVRGGSADGGWSYGWSALWKPIAGAMALGLLVPWSMTQLWNDRWNRLSFGPHEFSADADHSGLLGRWILVLAVPVGLVLIGLMAGASLARGTAPGLATLVVLVALLSYVIVPLVALAYYAAYFRECVGKTTLGELEFAFTARSKDWLKLFLGNLGLAIVTFGVGIIFWSYRNWAFFVRHLEAYGNVDPATLTQSTVAAAGDAEGLAGMFDIGAI